MSKPPPLRPLKLVSLAYQRFFDTAGSTDLRHLAPVPLKQPKAIILGRRLSHLCQLYSNSQSRYHDSATRGIHNESIAIALRFSTSPF